MACWDLTPLGQLLVWKVKQMLWAAKIAKGSHPRALARLSHLVKMSRVSNGSRRRKWDARADCPERDGCGATCNAVACLRGILSELLSHCGRLDEKVLHFRRRVGKFQVLIRSFIQLFVHCIVQVTGSETAA